MSAYRQMTTSAMLMLSSELAPTPPPPLKRWPSRFAISSITTDVIYGGGFEAMIMKLDAVEVDTKIVSWPAFFDCLYSSSRFSVQEQLHDVAKDCNYKPIAIHLVQALLALQALPADISFVATDTFFNNFVREMLS